MSDTHAFRNWMPEAAPIDACDAGRVDIDTRGPFVAGSYQRFVLTYTVGRYGIDDTGSLKICYRFASDMGRPQFNDPAAPNWVSATASNGATLDVRFDPKQNTRPWDRTIYIKVAAGFMREGDTITVRFGTDSRGPGMRMQTFVDPDFCFRVLVDPIATYTYAEVPDVPALPIVAGPAVCWHAVLPTSRRVGDRFALRIRADDMWGNPTTDRGLERVRLIAAGDVSGLTPELTLSADLGTSLEGLSCDAASTVSIAVLDGEGWELTRSNALVVEAGDGPRTFWGDLHAQSGETIGSGTVDDYMRYARDCAFIDMVGHQGNDFQITPEFWHRLGSVMREWNEPGRFVTLPGYEWSGNTALGGDRNVFYRSETAPIHRSSHALVPDRSDIASDCWDVRALFSALSEHAADTVVWAHCGGRYADIAYAHDHALERSVEVHSSWGTFEWLARDAFENGYRVGIVANSDGHKGRPGAEPPGASMFGALGGLTCYVMETLSRDALFDALKARHHYATTGARLHMTAEAHLEAPATLWLDDPRVPGARGRRDSHAIMGDIVATDAGTATFEARIVASSPILWIELRRGADVLETMRPHADLPLGRRFRIEWSGAEYRGRARQTVWDGGLKVSGAEILAATPINFLNPDRPLRRISPSEVAWASITTGNVCGVEIELDADDATIEVTTALGTLSVRTAELGAEPRVRDFGMLDRALSICRLPDVMTVTEFAFSRRIDLQPGDNPLWIAASFCDGHKAWSSPIYFIPPQGG